MKRADPAVRLFQDRSDADRQFDAGATGGDNDEI